MKRWINRPGTKELRVQLLLWTVLPLTLALVTVAVLGINTHQRSMRRLVEELDARSARLAAAQLSDKLEERVALLELMLAGRPIVQHHSLNRLFDGGLANFNASGRACGSSPFDRSLAHPSHVQVTGCCELTAYIGAQSIMTRIPPSTK